MLPAVLDLHGYRRRNCQRKPKSCQLAERLAMVSIQVPSTGTGLGRTSPAGTGSGTGGLLGWGGRAGAGRRRVASGWACTPWWPSAGAEGCCVVLWPGPKEPPCVAGVSGGRGGSPIAVPERPPAGGGVRWCSGTAIARASVMLTVGGWGEWPGPPGRVRARAGRAAVPGLPWPGNPGCRRYRRAARVVTPESSRQATA